MRNFYLLTLCFYSLWAFSQPTPVEIKLDPEHMETCDLGLSDFVESISAPEFISYLENKKPDNRKIKGPQSAVDAFKKLAKKVDEEDNPIIMIMKLKE